MTSKNNGNENLKRGTSAPQVPGTVVRSTPDGGQLVVGPKGGLLKRGGNPPRKAAEEEIVRQTRERLQSNDPAENLEVIAEAMTVLVRTRLERATRARGTEIDATTLNLVKEFRQTLVEVNEARRAAGALLEFQEFMGEIDKRVMTTLERAGLPQPPVTV